MEMRNLVETKRGRGTFVSKEEEVLTRVKRELVEKTVEKFWQEMSSLGFDEQEIIQVVEDHAEQL
jgi:GntR family transcriptional regulator